KKTYTIPNGEKPRFTNDARWVGAYIRPPLAKKIDSKKGKLRRGLALMNVNSGEAIKYRKVKNYSFSNDGKWVTILFYQSKKIKKQKNDYLGSRLLLLNLENKKERYIPFVRKAAFDSTSTYLTYS